MLEFIFVVGLVVSLLGLIYIFAKDHFEARKLYLRNVEALEMIADELNFIRQLMDNI